MTIIAICILIGSAFYLGWRVQWHADDPGVAHEDLFADYPSVGSEVRE